MVRRDSLAKSFAFFCKLCFYFLKQFWVIGTIFVIIWQGFECWSFSVHLGVDQVGRHLAPQNSMAPIPLELAGDDIEVDVSDESRVLAVGSLSTAKSGRYQSVLATLEGQIERHMIDRIVDDGAFSVSIFCRLATYSSN